jgi:hypothetical protein
VELDFALLADSVSVNPADGKLTIVGAGIDTVVAPAVPAQHYSKPQGRSTRPPGAGTDNAGRLSRRLCSQG